MLSITDFNNIIYDNYNVSIYKISIELYSVNKHLDWKFLLPFCCPIRCAFFVKYLFTE